MDFQVRKIQESDVEGFRAALDSVVCERIYLQTVDTPSSEKTLSFIRKNIKNNYAQYVRYIDGFYQDVNIMSVCYI